MEYSHPQQIYLFGRDTAERRVEAVLKRKPTITKKRRTSSAKQPGDLKLFGYMMRMKNLGWK